MSPATENFAASAYEGEAHLAFLSWEVSSSSQPYSIRVQDWLRERRQRISSPEEKSSLKPGIYGNWAISGSGSSETQKEAKWFRPVTSRLDHLRQLQDQWNGPGSSRVDIDVILRTLKFLAGIALSNSRPPSISPGNDGSLQLAWYTRDFELEIDVPRSGALVVSFYDHASGRETGLSPASPQLSSLMERLATD